MQFFQKPGCDTACGLRRIFTVQFKIRLSAVPRGIRNAPDSNKGDIEHITHMRDRRRLHIHAQRSVFFVYFISAAVVDKRLARRRSSIMYLVGKTQITDRGL